jgi:hypothetical protein
MDQVLGEVDPSYRRRAGAVYQTTMGSNSTFAPMTHTYLANFAR